MSKIIATAITADTVAGRTLLALRAGPMTNSELNERFPAGHQSSVLARAGLVEETESGWRITDAGRAACPLRNPAAANVTPPSAAKLTRSPAPIGLPARTAPQTHVNRPAKPIQPIQPGGHRMSPAAQPRQPTATDQVRRLLAEAPDGLARKDIIKRSGLTDGAIDNAIYNLVKSGDVERPSYGVIAATGQGARSIRALLSSPAPAAEIPAPEAVKPAASGAVSGAVSFSGGVDFAIYDDGRLAISDGDEVFVLPPDATRRLGQFLGRIEINGWPAHV